MRLIECNEAFLVWLREQSNRGGVYGFKVASLDMVRDSLVTQTESTVQACGWIEHVHVHGKSVLRMLTRLRKLAICNRNNLSFETRYSKC